ncbi:hypothetical protein CC1G_09653 [Coprinopsis cinerea okayama7|uniref:Uncharacterized protein n=1 Tax=Coprinopsis cinerea (strain Okayama-7 / 130 / ATCC MYA-4618 / FGSC 9003) TaxID=240176 RepID=A8P9D9_COPC7|nr:hypothetical protein CC1G_09653 [Coprinopsis cinerea okayama7\|eukprot:XP_001839750.2 hypothetical protein CC1G_09653 [Coprinopsis cinerea okayama7\
MTTGSMTVLQLARDSQFYYSAPASDTAPPSTQVNTEEYDSEWEEFVQGPSQSLADLETASQLLYNPLTKDCYFSTSPVSTPSTSPPPSGRSTPSDWLCSCDSCRWHANLPLLTPLQKAERERMQKALDEERVRRWKERRERNVGRARGKVGLQVERARRVVALALDLGEEERRRWEEDEGACERRREVVERRARSYFELEYYYRYE